MLPAGKTWSYFSHPKRWKTTRRDEYGGLEKQGRPRAFYYPQVILVTTVSFLRGRKKGGGGGRVVLFSTRYPNSLHIYLRQK